MNEELPSTNEELSISKKELQSIEEPTMLNAQLQDKVQELTAVNDDLANLLVSTSIATVLLDTDLRIKRFTTAASHLLNLQKSDTGRPMTHIASNLVGIELSGDARTVLDSLTPLEKEVGSQDGRQYLLRVLPYRTGDNAVQGVVLTLVDVTTLKQIECDLQDARRRVTEELRRMTRLHELSAQVVGPGDLHAMLDSVIHAAVDITGAEMGNIQRCDEAGVLTIAAHAGFDRPFLDFFAHVDAHTDSAYGTVTASRQRVLVDDVTTSPAFAGQPSLAVMVEAGVRALQSTPLFDRSGRFLGVFSTHYRSVHHFDQAERRWLDLLTDHAADVIERQKAEQLLARSRQDLEQRVADRTRWLSLMHDVALAINEAATWDAALHQVLRRLCQAEHWQIGYVYLPEPENPDTLVPAISCFGEERFRPFHIASEREHFMRGESLPGRVYAENTPFWANESEELFRVVARRATAARQVGLRAAVALPIATRDGVIAVMELFSDQPHPPSEQLATFMHGVGDQIGRVLERERATARMADLVWREQQDLLHTLHDSLGQTLTGLGMLSAGLRRQLSDSNPATAESAAEIARQAQHALGQMRRLTKNLFPVDVDAESLMAALRDLASATGSLHKIHVSMEGDTPKTLHDGKVATELYRIAQEAVTNSVKHAQPQVVSIRIEEKSGVLQLRIADDGIGISRPEAGDGAGLQIMRHRAASIGATLAVERGAAGGTIVTCALRQPPGSKGSEA